MHPKSLTERGTITVKISRDPEMPAHKSERSIIRYAVVALATVMAVLLYNDRICISFLEPYIRADLNLTKTQTSWLMSGFFWAYALGQVPAGWLSD